MYSLTVLETRSSVSASLDQNEGSAPLPRRCWGPIPAPQLLRPPASPGLLPQHWPRYPVPCVSLSPCLSLTKTLRMTGPPRWSGVTPIPRALTQRHLQRPFFPIRLSLALPPHTVMVTGPGGWEVNAGTPAFQKLVLYVTSL